MNTSTKTHRPHSINIESRAKANLQGVEKVIASNPDQISVITTDGALTILGADLRILKFDSDLGTFAIEGKINTVKYQGQKESFAKRIFK